MHPTRLVLASLAALLATSCVCSARRLAEAPAPGPEAPNAATGPIAVVYEDAGCLGTAIAGAQDPYFGSMAAPDGGEPITFVRAAENNGLSNDSAAICASAAVSLVSPCTAQFTAVRSGDMLFLQPSAAVSVAAAPECAVSHCQGGVASVAAEGGAANGTFYNRGTGAASFPVAIAAEGDSVVSVTVTTPVPGLTCTLLFDVAQGSVYAALGPAM